MKTWWYLWRMVRFRPRLYLLNVLFISAALLLESVPGLAARSFFDHLSALVDQHVVGLGAIGWLWWLIIVPPVAGLAEVAILMGCQLTNAPFILTNAAHNYLGKLAMAILLTPLIYAGHGLFNRYFHLPERESVQLDSFLSGAIIGRPTQYVRPTGIPSGEAFGLAAVRST